jgi:hypothetical protein
LLISQLGTAHSTKESSKKLNDEIDVIKRIKGKDSQFFQYSELSSKKVSGTDYYTARHSGISPEWEQDERIAISDTWLVASVCQLEGAGLTNHVSIYDVKTETRTFFALPDDTCLCFDFQSWNKKSEIVLSKVGKMNGNLCSPTKIGETKLKLIDGRWKALSDVSALKIR